MSIIINGIRNNPGQGEKNSKDQPEIKHPYSWWYNQGLLYSGIHVHHAWERIEVFMGDTGGLSRQDL